MEKYTFVIYTKCGGGKIRLSIRLIDSRILQTLAINSFCIYLFIY